MKNKGLIRLRSTMAAAFAVMLSGCCTSKECQLEHVAKDWCMTIRASQVMPVYPLTEDLQPGDAFLVQVPIDQQQRVYEQKGFLPLDNHLARLNPKGYSNFYANSFLARTPNSLLPHDWAHPPDTNYSGPAPGAAFPSYTFSVRRGAGMNLAVPVQGVPVGLSLLGSDAADGTITIKQARTMGVDTLSLWGELQVWARGNASFLRRFGAGPQDKETNYIRVVTRVYATGQMDVNLRDTSSRSGGVDVGAAKPVNLLFPELPQGNNAAAVVAQNYTNGWNLLNDILQKATATDAAGKFLPGGSLRLAAASSRSLTLQEEFNPPLILGYLGFDCVIEEDGTLGSPMPTHAVIDRTVKLHHAKVQKFNDQLKDQIALYNAIAERYRKATPAEQKKIRDLAQQAKLSANGSDQEWLEGLGWLVDGNDPAKTQRFRQLQDLLDQLDHSH